MGTLTANQDRLPEYCEHKLPTSCRLTSIPNCCACADERAHAAAYRTYIDGVGFVPRGTRWQRYCWFCKEFWEHRVTVSGLRPGQTRIPEVPDQTDFLERWYDFHRGYRIVKRDDGSEERVGLLGEDFREVGPGELPRTLEELRIGRRVEDAASQAQQETMQEQEQTGPSLEDTLEQMFAAASAEDDGTATRVNPSNVQQQSVNQEPVQHTNIHAQAMNPAPSRNREHQVRRVAALRRELNRMRNGIERVISGLRDLGEDVPNYTETTGRLTALGDTLDTISGAPSREQTEQIMNGVNALATSVEAESQSVRALAVIQARVDEARTQTEEARRARDQAASELDAAESEFRSSQQRLQQLQREQRSTENYIRIFGTREEMLAQGENYESPIGGMFTRAYERFHAAEEVRREQRTLRQVLEEEAAARREEEARRLSELDSMDRDVWGVPRPRRDVATADQSEVPRTIGSVPTTSDRAGREPEEETPPELIPTGDETVLEEYYSMLRRQDRRRQASSDHPVGIQRQETLTDQQDTPATNPFHTPSMERLSDMLVEANERRVQERQRAQQLSGSANDVTRSQHLADAARAPYQLLEEWWHVDASHVIRALATDEELRNELGMMPEDASVLLSYFMNDGLSESDRTTIDGLLRNPTVIWRTGLPQEWLLTRRATIGNHSLPSRLLFEHDDSNPSMQDWANHHNSYMRTEIVAQAYQMSSGIRLRARNLSPPERLQVLYRLQAGRRSDQDVRLLERLRDDDDTYSVAEDVYYMRVQRLDDVGDTEQVRRREVEDERRAMARRGDHSRDELEARRQDTTQAFALAAGRQAMQTGSEGVLEQMADREEGTRAAYRRLQDNNFVGRRPQRTTLYRQLTLSDYLNDASSDSASEDGQEPEGRGLDAQDSGRPEPKSDEELRVQMECRICYTQMAEVACLPCGHLVMCRWCSDQHSPSLQHDRTRPRRAAACPVCRKGIRQKVKVFRA